LPLVVIQPIGLRSVQRHRLDLREAQVQQAQPESRVPPGPQGQQARAARPAQPDPVDPPEPLDPPVPRDPQAHQDLLGPPELPALEDPLASPALPDHRAHKEFKGRGAPQPLVISWFCWIRKVSWLRSSIPPIFWW
jgi:hypothetical protein